MEKKETIAFNFTSDEIFKIVLEHLTKTKQIDGKYNSMTYYSFSHELEVDDDEIMFSVKVIKGE